MFCKIVEGKLPAKVREETKNVIAFDSIDPIATTHIIIIPKEHIVSFIDIQKSHHETIIDMMEVINKLIQARDISAGYKIIVNGGKYQVVKHLHWHLVGGKLGELNAL
ncbi:HIT domain-containing protein [Candidatus Woesebacteria bacterium]|nr:MAG: HIT domain-containing protein [Candidatus Woesebacteria bacterium]